MFITIKQKPLLLAILILSLAGAIFFFTKTNAQNTNADGEFIKWVDFKAAKEILQYAIDIDVKSQTEEVKINWIDLLAHASAKSGGDLTKAKRADIDKAKAELIAGFDPESLKYFNHYKEVYTAIFAEFVGPYKIQVKDETAENGKAWVDKYGVKAFSPIAKAFPYTHYEDFGTGRSYGYRRKHLGNDLLGSVGTPIIAVESGIIEELGWNMYGGWRIGIRSYDTKRYYYYAHLRKNFPFNKALQIGSEVKAGDVIGYLGRSGYSTTENTNNIEIPHLHFGLQLIFDESQKEGKGEIWIDVYQIVRLLDNKRSETIKNEETNEYTRVYDIEFP